MSDKVTVQTKISLTEKGKFLSNETKVAEILSNVFENAVSKLGINKDDTKFHDVPVLSTNPVGIAIRKFDTSLFDYHLIVTLIRDNYFFTCFNMKMFLLKEIKNFSSAKSCSFKNIVTRSQKENANSKCITYGVDDVWKT